MQTEVQREHLEKFLEVNKCGNKLTKGGMMMMG